MQSFSCLEIDEMLASAIKIEDHYSEQLATNGCNIDCLNVELRILYSHVNKFSSNVTPSKRWPCLFKLKEGLGIKNILHIAEICISIPMSNAECECIFSFLWRQLTKDRFSMNNKTLERILQFRFGTGDYSIEHYDHAIDFLIEDNQTDIIIHRIERKQLMCNQNPLHLLKSMELCNKQQQSIKLTL